MCCWRRQWKRPERVELAGAMATTGPAELPRLLAAFAGQDEAVVGRAVVEALRQNDVSRSLDPATVTGALEGFGTAVAAEVEALVAEIRVANGEKLAEIERLVAAVDASEGDIRRGLAVFRSTKAACSSCHELGFLGGQIGPDLTHVGRIRTAPDLAEAILFPSAAFVRGYESTTVVTVDGVMHMGVIRDESRGKSCSTSTRRKRCGLPWPISNSGSRRRSRSCRKGWRRRSRGRSWWI